MGNARDKFVTLAEARTTKAIRMIRLIGNLSNKSNYTYAEKDVTAIFRRLNLELRNTKERFSHSSKRDNEIHFSLEDAADDGPE